MRRLILLFSLFALPVLACTFEYQTFPEAKEQTPTIETGVPGTSQILEGPEISYNGIRFNLDPQLASQLYVYNEVTTIDGATAHQTRFAMSPEDFCQTWCLMVYPVAEFEQAFGTFVFPPAGYRGGAAVVFHAKAKSHPLKNGIGDRALETFGQSGYGVSNESLKYVFRGYTSDKKYGVYLQAPVRTASLPDVTPTLSADVQEILESNLQTAERMDTLTPGDFTPSLDVLDALVASIQVQAP